MARFSSGGSNACRSQRQRQDVHLFHIRGIRSTRIRMAFLAFAAFAALINYRRYAPCLRRLDHS